MSGLIAFNYIKRYKENMLTEAKSDLNAIINDVMCYYVSHDTIDSTLNSITSIPIGLNGEFFVNNHPCLKLEIKDNFLYIKDINKGSNEICTLFIENLKELLFDLSKGEFTIKLSALKKAQIDEEITKSINDLSNIINDIMCHYIGHGTINGALNSITSIPIGLNGEFFVNNHPCLKLEIKDNFLYIKDINKGSNEICNLLLKQDSLKSMLGCDIDKDGIAVIKLSGFNFFKN